MVEARDDKDKKEDEGDEVTNAMAQVDLNENEMDPEQMEEDIR